MGPKVFGEKYDYLVILLHFLVQILIVLLITTEEVFADLYKFQKLANVQSERIIRREKRDERYSGEISNLRGKPGQGYEIEVEIGTPKQKLHVLIDTGSSNFAVACADNPDISTYFKRELSSTYKDLGRDVHVPYTEGSWDGVLGRDVVSIPSLPNVTVHANIACITKAKGFYINGSNWQGILGLGYAAISRPDSSVVPFMDSLVQEGGVSNYFSMELCGSLYNLSNPDKDLTGSLLFGGSEPFLYMGPLYSTPINKEWYYEVVIVDVEVDHVSLGMDCKEYNFGKTIVDSGTTNLRLPAKVYNALIAKMRKSVEAEVIHIPDSSGFWWGLAFGCWAPGAVPYNKFPTIALTFPVNKTAAFKLVISAQQYLRPVGKSNDTEPQDCYKLAIASSDSGSVIGAVVLEGFYTVFNRQEKTIQFAESKCSVIDQSAIKSHIRGNIALTADYTDCVYAKIDTENKSLTIVGYVMAGICGVCLIPLLVLILRWQCLKCRQGRKRSGSDSNGLVDYGS